MQAGHEYPNLGDREWTSAMRMILVAFAISAAFAQHPEFEVASVKRAVDVPFGGRIPISGPLAERLGFEGGPGSNTPGRIHRSEEHTSELQSLRHLVCRLLLGTQE